jgi:arginine:pyruvate transaminase
MKPSDRVKNILGGGGDGWEILIEARRIREAGGKVLNLTIGEHDRPTAAAFIDAMAASAHGGNTGYAPFSGAQPLRAAIAQRVSRTTGAPALTENICVTIGGQAALFAALYATVDRGDRVVTIDPYYATYPGTIRAAGGEFVPSPADPATGFQPDLAALDAACAGARTLMINTPHNPTGAVYSRETLEAIAEICIRRDLWLISDEVYDGMVWEGRHISPRSLPGMAERTIVVGSMSKSHAMTGFRLGWVAAPEEIADYVGDLVLNTTYGVAGFIQDAALYALRNGETEEAEISALFHRRRDAALGALEGANAIRAVASQGAMYVMLDVRATGLSGKDFAWGLVNDRHIAVMPGESFGDAGAGHLRVALTVEEDKLRDAFHEIAAYAAERAA